MVLPIPRVGCRTCGTVRQVPVRLGAPRRHYTRAFAAYALELLGGMTLQDAANLLGVSWGLLKALQKEHLQAHYGRPVLSQVRRIAIDEICIGRPRRFLTIVLDLDSHRVLFVGDGKGYGSLEPFWERVKQAGARIEAVALDMGPAFNAAVMGRCPNAVIVYDRYHVHKRFNDLLTFLRRDLYHEATSALHQKVLQGTRWLLLKNAENLDVHRDEHGRLEEALRLNQPLAAAYYLKEDLRRLWDQPDKAQAKSFLKDWVARAYASGIRRLKTFAKNLLVHRHRLLAWYDHPISTGPLEGTNNKIKTMQRQAYGYRDIEFFVLKIYALHKVKYALVG